MEENWGSLHIYEIFMRSFLSNLMKHIFILGKSNNFGSFEDKVESVADHISFSIRIGGILPDRPVPRRESGINENHE